MILNKDWLLKKLDNIKVDNRKYELVNNKKEQLTIKANTEDVNIYIHSKYSPDVQGFRFAANIADEQDVFLYGLGLGYHAVSIIERLNNNNNILYILECNMNLIKLAFDNTNIIDYLDNDNVVFCGSDRPEDIKGFISSIDTEYNISIYDPCMKVIPKELKVVQQWFMNYKIEKNSIGKFSDQMKQNHNHNIELGYPNGVTLFKDKFQDMPCIIVSAGPSLKTNIEILKKVQDKAIIIAVGRTATILQDNDITPTMWIESDCQQMICSHFFEVENHDIPLAFLSTANKNIEYCYEGDKVILYEESYCPEGEDSVIGGGGSVAVIALKYALKLGCNPIAFVGQDLCFDGTVSHYNSDSKRLISKATPKVMGVDNQIHYTNEQFDMMRSSIEQVIRQNEDKVFINCSNGARISGTKEMKLREVFSKYNAIDKQIVQYIRTTIQDNQPKDEIKVFTCEINIV